MLFVNQSVVVIVTLVRTKLKEGVKVVGFVFNFR